MDKTESEDLVATPAPVSSSVPMSATPATPTLVAESIAALPAVKVPADYDPEKYAKCKALFDFTARAVHELSFKAGDTVRLWDDRGNDWCLGESDMRAGYFPGNYVQRTNQAPAAANKSGMLHGNVSPQIQRLAVMAGLLDQKEKEKENAKPATMEHQEPSAVTPIAASADTTIASAPNVRFWHSLARSCHSVLTVTRRTQRATTERMASRRRCRHRLQRRVQMMTLRAGGRRSRPKSMSCGAIRCTSLHQ